MEYFINIHICVRKMGMEILLKKNISTGDVWKWIVSKIINDSMTHIFINDANDFVTKMIFMIVQHICIQTQYMLISGRKLILKRMLLLHNPRKRQTYNTCILIQHCCCFVSFILLCVVISMCKNFFFAYWHIKIIRKPPRIPRV